MAQAVESPISHCGGLGSISLPSMWDFVVDMATKSQVFLRVLKAVAVNVILAMFRVN